MSDEITINQNALEKYISNSNMCFLTCSLSQATLILPNSVWGGCDDATYIGNDEEDIINRLIRAQLELAGNTMSEEDIEEAKSLIEPFDPTNFEQMMSIFGFYNRRYRL